MQSYKSLIVWQKSVELATEVYQLTKSFPKEEVYGLASQMRRASVSIASNLAEGKLRASKKEWTHFLHIAFGSGGELETQIEIAKRVFGAHLDYHKTEILLGEVMRMLNVLISKASS